MDKSRTGFVSLDEYQETLNGLRGEGDNDGAVRFLFKIYDSNGMKAIRLMVTTAFSTIFFIEIIK